MIRAIACATMVALVAVMPAWREAATTIHAIPTAVKEEAHMEYSSIEAVTSTLDHRLAALEARLLASLGQRYGREFRILKMGALPGAEQMDLYACPADDETLVFDVHVNEAGTASDNYVARLRLREFERSLEAALAGAGTEAAVQAVIPDCDTTDLTDTATLAELLRQPEVPGVLVRVVLRAPVTSTEGVAQALKEAGLSLEALAVFNGYVFDDAGFDAARKALLETPNTTDAIIDAIGPRADFSLAVEDGACRVTRQREIRIGGGDLHAD